MLRTQNVHTLEDSRRPGPGTASPTGFSQSTRPSPLGTLLTAAAASLQSCPILCDPIDGSPPGSLVPGILRARTLEWVAISFSNA